MAILYRLMRRDLLDYQLAQESFTDYLQYACPVDPAHKNMDACRTHPQYFIWPSDRFFIHYRPNDLGRDVAQPGIWPIRSCLSDCGRAH
jgi:hypothetical protein